MNNIWNIREYEGDGISCPIQPVNLPWYKTVVLFLFRFGICPLCVTSSIGYSLVKAVRPLLNRPPWNRPPWNRPPWIRIVANVKPE